MTNITISTRTHSLVLTKSFAAKAAIFGTDEYKMLQEARRDYPGYKVTVGKTKNKEQKNIYAGLDCDYMEKYIKAHDKSEDKAVLKEFYSLRGCDEEGKKIDFAPVAPYGTLKQWFLTYYPEVAKMNDTVAEILKKAQAKREAAKKAA